VNAAHAFEPAVVLLDIGLPGMDGYEVAGQMRSQERFRETMIVALSGYIEDADRARAAGFDHHFVKPVNFAALDGLLSGLTAH
jgi:two-component system CheB/CheR fusion protein